MVTEQTKTVSRRQRRPQTAELVPVSRHHSAIRNPHSAFRIRKFRIRLFGVVFLR